VEALSSVVILKALDGLHARIVGINENISNANSPGYRPVRVSFEQALIEAAGQGPDAVRALQPSLERDPAGSTVKVGLEMATAAQTAARYTALIGMLSQQFQLRSLAITGNG
jgi:flagellar basal-body rod protein FlgB